jgi:microcystin-dependent protein
MAEPFLAEIRLMSFSFPPKGWALCDGQVLPINQNQALFSLLGTTYGGDGRVNFALPNLEGRMPIHVGNGHTLGESGGAVSHTLTTSEMPTHLHQLQGSGADGDSPVPTGRVLSGSPSQLYSGPSSLTALNPASITTVGGSQPHTNQQPYLVLSFCIALQGIFPSRN